MDHHSAYKSILCLCTFVFFSFCFLILSCLLTRLFASLLLPFLLFCSFQSPASSFISPSLFLPTFTDLSPSSLTPFPLTSLRLEIVFPCPLSHSRRFFSSLLLSSSFSPPGPPSKSLTHSTLPTCKIPLSPGVSHLDSFYFFTNLSLTTIFLRSLTSQEVPLLHHIPYLHNDLAGNTTTYLPITTPQE